MRALILGLTLLTAAADVTPAYKAQIEKYRKDRIAELTAPNRWLAVQGLFWLHDGENAGGSDAASAIALPSRAPKGPACNRVYNPPCAFTDFATCPLPVKENQLPVRIPAGELRWGH